MGEFKPATTTDVVEAIASSKGAFDIVGSGSKRGLGRAVEADHVLDMSAFSRMIAYEPEELIIEAESSVLLADVEALLDQHNQMLAFEPPPGGTLGGMLNCNLSGSRRLTAGAARDHLLGVHAVDGRGVAFKTGGRVVKNVTGYDMPKLIAGSYGTLAVATSFVLKVLPKPEAEETLVVAVPDVHCAVEIMGKAVRSVCAVSCAAYVPDRGVCLRLEGIPRSVQFRRNKLLSLIGLPSETLEMTESQAIWKTIRDVVDGSIVWRVSLPPTDAPGFIDSLPPQLDFMYKLDWAGGLIWIGTNDATHDVRKILKSGHATLFHAPNKMRATVPVFQPQSPALAALTARIKTAFDPSLRMNPGRMYEGS